MHYIVWSKVFVKIESKKTIMKSSSIKVGAFISYISVFLTIAITFFYTPWMIRQIGVSDYGLYSLVITFIAYFVMDFGMSGTVTRFIAKYRAEGNEQKVGNLMGLILKVYLSIDVIIFLVLLVVGLFLSGIFQGLTHEELEKLRILYAIAALFSVLNFVFKPMHGAMMAYEYFVETKLIDMVQKVGTVLLIVIALLMGMGVYALVFINGAVALVTSLFLYVLFLKKSRLTINFRYFDKPEMKALLGFSIWIFLITMAQRFRLTFMPSLLGMFANSTEISLFSLGMSIEGMVYVLSSALNGLFLPKVSRLSHEGDINAITDLMIRVGRIQFFVISLIFFGFVILGQDFLNLWVGEKFHNTYFVVLLLIGTNMVSLTQHVASDLVYAENKVRYTATLTFVASGLALLGSVLLAPTMGAVGCALSFFGAMSLNLFQLNVFYKKKLHVDVGRFFRKCHYKLLPSMCLVSVCFWGIKQYVLADTWGMLILFGSLYSLAVVTLDYLFLFNSEEKSIIRNFIHRK